MVVKINLKWWTSNGLRGELQKRRTIGAANKNRTMENKRK